MSKRGLTDSIKCIYNSWPFSVHIIAQLEKSSQINGVVVIMDFDGLSLKQVKALSPSYTKRLLTFIQDAMPLRLKEVHFVKQPFIFNMVWTLFKPFVKEKLKNRVRKKISSSVRKFLTKKFFCFLRCGSMEMTWRSFTSMFQLKFCQRTTAEQCRNSTTREKTGIHALRSTFSFSTTGTLTDSNKQLGSSKCQNISMTTAV